MAASDAAVAPFDVIVVPFPYSERLAEKRRPALVVSNARLHREGYLWIVMITGAGKQKRAGVAAPDLPPCGGQMFRQTCETLSRRRTRGGVWPGLRGHHNQG